MTIDFWGTLFVDGPDADDDRYRWTRVNDFERILAAAGERATRGQLDLGYEASGAWLGSVWSRHRDVPVQEHVRAILAAVNPDLPGRIPEPTLQALVVAYARPALVVPPAVDDGAREALDTLRARGLTLAVVSNTMRTPGATLRGVLAHFGLLDSFACTVFSDEVGVRKPDPEIFLRALRAVGGVPETSVHVGDDRVLDVQGARAAGMHAIQVTSRRLVAGPASPDAVILRLAALPAAVGDLEVR